MPGTSHIKLGYGWSQADSLAWAEEVRRQGGTSYSIERETKRGIIRSSVRPFLASLPVGVRRCLCRRVSVGLHTFAATCL